MENEISIKIRAEDKFTEVLEKIETKLHSTSVYTDQWGRTIKEVQKHIEPLAKGVRSVTQETTKYNFGVKTLKEGLEKVGLSQNQFNTWMEKNNYEAVEGKGIMDSLTGEILSYGKASKMAGIEIKKFKSEYLSLLFAALALDRVFGGLVQTQMELFGVTDMLSSAWTVVLLPIMELITPILYKLLEFFMDMPEPVKLLVGGFIIFVAVLSKLASIILMGLAGWAGVLKVFPHLATAISKAGGIWQWLGSVFTGVSVTMLAVVAAIVAIIVGMYLAFKENFMNMKDVVRLWIDGFKQGFNGLITFFKGIWNIISGIFTMDGERMIKGFKQLFSGLWNFLVGGFKITISTVVAVGIGILRVAIGTLQGLINVFLSAYDNIARFFGGRGTSYRVDWVSQLSVPSFQTGGIMPHTGLALLHKGEEIVPKREVSGEQQVYISPNITINASVSNDMDIRRLASQLNVYFADEMRRLSQQRR